MRLGLSLGLAAMLLAAPALAQTVPNPLRPSAQPKAQAAAPAEDAAPVRRTRTRAPKAQEAEKASADTGAAQKPKRARSAKQLQNDEDMRACGADWRANKGTLQGEGKTWRSFLGECRGKRKLARGA